MIRPKEKEPSARPAKKAGQEGVRARVVGMGDRRRPVLAAQRVEHGVLGGLLDLLRGAGVDMDASRAMRTFGFHGRDVIVPVPTFDMFINFADMAGGRIVLLGAELNAEIEAQTRADTTVGPDEPMGTRGAQKADHLGEAHRS